MKVKFALLLAVVSAANIDSASQADVEVEAEAEIDEEPKVLS